jgi:fused signal recognition particle receptor
MNDLMSILNSFNPGDWSAFGGMGSLALFSLFQLIRTKKAESLKDSSSKVVTEQVQKPEVIKVEDPGPSWSDRLKTGLSRSRNEVWGKIGKIFSNDKISEDDLEQIEEILYASDMGPKIVEEIIENFKENSKKENRSFEDFKTWTRKYLAGKLSPIQEALDPSLFIFDKENHHKLKVFMIVGVNGAGKTTTVGKLATKLKKQGANVVVGACDTFRAAAVEQLEVWCQRAGVKMIKADNSSDPSAVAYDTLKKAIQEKADYCLLDTAGRLHTNQALMNELEKTKRVLKKLDPSVPDQILLVIDSITGQNANAQAREFNQALDLTGLVLTKCDGSSKAGNAVAIVDELKIPIAYIGVGESAEDLEVFSQVEYLDALLG